MNLSNSKDKFIKIVKRDTISPKNKNTRHNKQVDELTNNHQNRKRHLNFSQTKNNRLQQCKTIKSKLYSFSSNSHQQLPKNIIKGNSKIFLIIKQAQDKLHSLNLSTNLSKQTSPKVLIQREKIKKNKNMNKQVATSRNSNHQKYFISKSSSQYSNSKIKNVINKKTLENLNSQKIIKRIRTSKSKDSTQYYSLKEETSPKVINMSLNFNVNLQTQYEPYSINSSKNQLLTDSKTLHIGSQSSRNFKNNFFKKNQLQQKINYMNEQTRRNLFKQKKQQSKLNQEQKQLILSKKPDQYFKKNPFNVQNIQVIKKIGNGQHGDIYLVKSKQNNFVFVLKCFKKKAIHLDFMIEQFKIQLYCYHPNILKGFGFHIGKTEAYLAIEAGNTNLFKQVRHKGLFSQQKTSNCIKQILQGLQYLHSNGIIHRDIKPQNIILFGNNNDIYKISDFGWSTVTDIMRKTFCGTYQYVSPEVALGAYYDFKIDSWSMGILAFELLTGKLPFDQNKIMQKQFEKIGRVPKISKIGKQGQQFIQKLLTLDPSQRMSIQQALNHSWIKKFMLLKQQNVQKFIDINTN